MTQELNDVFAIGNALVDFEFQVKDSVFDELKLEKGLMTLVDREHQDQILTSLGTDVLKKKQCGGSAANSAIAVAQLGSRAYYCFKTAQDETGEFFQKDLKEKDVRFAAPKAPDQESQSGRCVVMVTDDAERSMFTYLGASSCLGPDDIDSEALKNSRYLYLEGYLVASPLGFDAMKEAYKMANHYGVKTAITLSDPNMVNFFKENFWFLLRQKVDVLFCNEKELCDLIGTQQFSKAFEEMKQYASLFAVTRGANGSIIWDGEKEVEVAALPVTAVDTNGAGDIYAGAFLHGLARGWDAKKCGDLASALAAKLVTQYGPRLTTDEAHQVAKDFL